MVTSRRLGVALLGAVALVGCDGTNSGSSGARVDIGSGSSQPPNGSATAGQLTYQYKIPDGFARFTELGERCGASYAINPTIAAGDLTFIPCTSGVRGCEQVEDRSWGRAIVSVDEQSSSYGFSFQVAHDENGNADKIMQSYEPTGTWALQQGSVVHDLQNGRPLAAWRNAQDHVVAEMSGSKNQLILPAGELECSIRPILAHDTVWILAEPADFTGIKVAHGPIADPTATTHFTLLDADSTVMFGTILASDEALAVEQSDGRITILHAADNSQISFYGPSMRVWLHSIVGADVIVYNDKGTDGILYFRISPDGAFLQLPRAESNLRINEDRLAWPVLQKQSDSQQVLVVRSEPYSSIGNAVAQTATQSNPIVPSKSVQLYPQFFLSGYYALLSSETPPTAYLVDVGSGSIRNLTIPSETGDTYSGGTALLAVTDSHVWLSHTMRLKPQYYRRLQRMAF